MNPDSYSNYPDSYHLKPILGVAADEEDTLSEEDQELEEALMSGDKKTVERAFESLTLDDD